MLTPRYLKHRWDGDRFSFRDNTPDEILAGVREMAALLDREHDSTSLQRDVRATIDTFLSTAYGMKKQKLGTYGTESFFLGRGWPSDECARWLVPSREPRHTAVTQ